MYNESFKKNTGRSDYTVLSCLVSVLSKSNSLVLYRYLHGL